MTNPIGGTLSGHFLRRAKARVKRIISPEIPEESPFRSELFNIEQMRVHAGVIAESHKLAAIPHRDQLLRRLDMNEEILINTYERVIAASSAGSTIPPAADWLIDNFYLIEDQFHIARKHLPKQYSRQLPQLAEGPMAGFPRIYHIVLELICAPRRAYRH